MTPLPIRLAERFDGARVYLVGPGYPIRCVQTRQPADGSPHVACLPVGEPRENGERICLQSADWPL